jgi:hypothetical protein
MAFGHPGEACLAPTGNFDREYRSRSSISINRPDEIRGRAVTDPRAGFLA